jgi:hypothetical protein
MPCDNIGYSDWVEIAFVKHDELRDFIGVYFAQDGSNGIYLAIGVRR